MTQISSSPKASAPPSAVHNDDPTEGTIARMIEGILTFLNPQYGNTTPEEEADAVIKINPAIKKYCELKIKMLRDSPRDADKLKQILKIKQKEYEKAEHIEDIERLVTEIEILRFVLFLVN
jgi:hypothetical protein